MIFYLYFQALKYLGLYPTPEQHHELRKSILLLYDFLPVFSGFEVSGLVSDPSIQSSTMNSGRVFCYCMIFHLYFQALKYLGLDPTPEQHHELRKSILLIVWFSTCIFRRWSIWVWTRPQSSTMNSGRVFCYCMIFYLYFQALKYLGLDPTPEQHHELRKSILLLYDFLPVFSGVEVSGLGPDPRAATWTQEEYFVIVWFSTCIFRRWSIWAWTRPQSSTMNSGRVFC